MHSMQSDFLNIAIATGLQGTSDDSTGKSQATVEDVKQWLSTTNVKWLMIVDDANENISQILGLLPRCSNGSIIFTTKSKATDSLLAIPQKIIEVGGLVPNDAKTMLLSRIGEETNSEPELMEILNSFEHIPLAISHMGSFMFANSCSLLEYIRIYNTSEESKIRLLSADSVVAQVANSDHITISNPVAHTLLVSFEQV